MTDAGVSRRRDWRLVELGRSNRREDGKRRDAATENENKTKQKRRRASTTDAEEACDLRREKRSVVDRRKIGRAAANTFAKKRLPNRQKKGKKKTSPPRREAPSVSVVSRSFFCAIFRQIVVD